LEAEPASLFAREPEMAGYFEAVCDAVGAKRDAGDGGVEPRVVANWITGDLTALLRQREAEEDFADPTVPVASLASLVEMVATKKISHGSGKTVLALLVAEGGDPAAIVEREGLAQMAADDGELEAVVAAAIAANPEAAEQIRAGNGKAIGAIVGAVMKETKGRADGGEVNRLLREQLGV
jgi:aspartyl-tRNA(Asn)/glutamyl-tRNA(Gln) amidotransferase subunit B